jgi:hypothetical protein
VLILKVVSSTRLTSLAKDVSSRASRVNYATQQQKHISAVSESREFSVTRLFWQTLVWVLRVPLPLLSPSAFSFRFLLPLSPSTFA